MYIDKLMNKFGYSEMYEWSELFEFNIVPYGRFVSFDNNEPGKIKLANNYDNIIGVTTINSVITSDDPNEWQGKYLCNEYGDCFLQKKDKAAAVNAYDDINKPDEEDGHPGRLKEAGDEKKKYHIFKIICSAVSGIFLPADPCDYDFFL